MTRNPFLGKKRSGTKIGNKSRHTFSLAFLDDFQKFAQILMGAGGLMSPQHDYIFIFFVLVRVRKCVEL